MADPEHAENVARVGGRVYTDPVTEEKFPSVTTIIGDTQSKDGLIKWSAKLAAEYAFDHVAAWVAVSESMTGPAEGRAAAVDLIKGASDRYRDSRGDLGSTVHAIIEGIVLDQPLPVVESGGMVDGMLNAFLQWVFDYEVTFFMSEITVANRTHRYAGTIDGGVTLGACGGRRFLIDVKTGNSIFAADAIAQMVAYRHAEEAWLPHGIKDAVPEVDGIAVLHLAYDEATDTWSYDFRDADEDKDDQLWSAFVKRCEHYYAQREIGTSRKLLRRVRRDNDPWYLTDVPSLNRCVMPLAAIGLTTLEQIVEFTDQDLLGIHGIGKKRVESIRAAIVAVGLAAKPVMV